MTRPAPALLALAALTAPCLAAAAPRFVVTQVPADRAALLPGSPLPGSPLRPVAGDGARLVLVEGGRLRRVLTEGFASAADPEVSFDGRRILFAGRRTASDPWNIFEMEVVIDPGSGPPAITRPPGSGPPAIRQVTNERADCRQPVYESTVYTLNADPTRGTDPWQQIAFVHTRPGELNEDASGPATSLFACRTDGTALQRLTYNLSSDADPVLLASGRLLYSAWQRSDLARGPAGRVALMGINEDGTDPAAFAAAEGASIKRMATSTTDGLVVFVEPAAQSSDAGGALAAVNLRRNLHSHRVLTRPEDGLFLTPAPLPGGDLLVSRRPANGSGTYGVCRFTPRTVRCAPVFDDPAWHDVQARRLAPRDPVPDARSSVVDNREPLGKLYGLNVYLTDQAASLPPGAARRLRVVEGVPRTAPLPTVGPSSPMAARRVLGEAPIESDGSYHVQVPADTPLELQVLGADGLALRRSGWVWVRGHGAQGCVGCHEDQELAPQNRFATALGKPAVVLTPPVAERRTVTFARDVAPLVARRCGACHAAGVATPEAAYRFAAGAVRPGEARQSPLMGRLSGAPCRTGLTADEVRAVGEWIDLGAVP